MRLIKMFGLAVAASVVAMAFMGASSASAAFSTQLCNNDLSPELNVCTDPTTSIHAVAQNPLLLGTFTFHCQLSLASATVLALGNPQIAHLTTVTFGKHDGANSCLRLTLFGGVEHCTVKAELLGLALILKTKANHASVQFHDTAVSVVCPSGIVNCTFGGLPTLLGEGAVLGSHNGKLVANALALERVENKVHPEGFCPAEAFWDATYVSLLPIFIKS